MLSEVDPTRLQFATLGQIGGTVEETLTVDQIPPHSHGIKGGWGAGSLGVGFFRVDTNSPATHWTDAYNRGGGQPHNNLQPYLTVGNWCITY